MMGRDNGDENGLMRHAPFLSSEYSTLTMITVAVASNVISIHAMMQKQGTAQCRVVVWEATNG